ncbi:hypothetical protein [Lactiplantibacillus paraxiangfangensis]|uniref:hypothetical protein n=1 Tax=Lactiplantibacillus paraxiangfangensis TaxID=3076224 RepID=UPI0030C71C82
MTMGEWYEALNTRLNADGIKVKFNQPQAKDTLPLVHVNVHTDSDASTKFDTLNQVEQQIDIYCEGTMAPFDFENYVQKVKWSISKVKRWNSLTTQTSIDDSIGRDLRRAMLLITVTI